MHDLYHVIYTNAPQYGSDGYRFVRPPPNDWGPKYKINELEQWILSLTCTSEPATVGYAYSCFRINTKPHVCLATVFPDFALDDYGRKGGNLTHVLITKVEEGIDNGLHIQALVERALALELPDMTSHSDRLAAYMGQKMENLIMIPDPSPEYIHEKLEKDQLTWLIRVAHDTVKQSREALLRVTTTAEGARTLAIYAAALPPRLRLAFYWGCEVAVGNSQRRQAHFRIKGDALFIPDPDGRLIPYTNKFLTQLSWLNQYDSASAWVEALWREWDIRSWEELFSKYG